MLVMARIPPNCSRQLFLQCQLICSAHCLHHTFRKWVEERTRAELLQSKLDTLVRYEVQVQTGDDKGAGTSARVYIQAWGRGDAFQGDDGLFLGGESAAGGRSPGTGEFRLLDVDSPVAPFARGAVDDFEVGGGSVLLGWHRCRSME